jgi:hypothetical protein
MAMGLNRPSQEESQAPEYFLQSAKTFFAGMLN